jgi:tetratricopeptide (TPR) repeat protein
MKAGLVKALLAAAAAGLLLFSCGPPKRPGLRPDMAQAQQRLAVGDFQGALISYAAIIESYPGDRDVLREYRGAVEKINAQADRWFEEKDFAAAEKTYSLLLANLHRFAEFEKPLPVGPEFLSRRILECQEHLSERRARQSLTEGDYLRALDSFKGLPQEVLRRPAQSAALRRIMEELKGLVDKALARKDFVAAGKGYATLWREYSMAQQVSLSLSFSRNDADEGMKHCRTQLTREGLDQYRKGNLKEAIAIWRGLLQFDPDNAEIRKAVDRATEQLKKLQKR